MRMDHSTIERWRVYLQIAAVTCVLIQTMALTALWLFHVPKSFFLSEPFRWHVIATMAVAVLLVRTLAAAAFRYAVDSRHARCGGDGMRSLSLEPDCPHRWLVVLHVRLHLCQFDRGVG
jgi:hypothetical protein